MDSPTGWLSQRIYYFASGLYFGAVLLRSLLIYRDSPVLVQVLGLLLVGLVLFISEPAISRRWSRYFPIYLLCQTALVFTLLSRPGFTDFFAALLPILSMQVMLHLNPKIGGGVDWLVCPDHDVVAGKDLWHFPGICPYVDLFRRKRLLRRLYPGNAPRSGSVRAKPGSGT